MKRFLIFALVALVFAPGLGAQVRHIADEQPLWVTVGQDAFDALRRTPGFVASHVPLKSVVTRGDVVLIQLPASEVEPLGQFMHKVLHRCGGFIVHDSKEEALAAMEGAYKMEFLAAPVTFQISQQTVVNQLVPQVAAGNIYNTIDHLSTAYVNRYYTTTTGSDAALWIRDQWQSLATGRSDVTVSTYNHAGYGQDSVILEIQGATTPGEIVVMGAHLDSIQSGQGSASVAPGADDDASGVAVLTEVIRVLMANGVTTDRTLKIMAYAAEEVGLRGSGDIAQDHLDNGDNVVAVMQFDMTGLFGSAEDIHLISDFTNADLNTFVGSLIDTYLPTLLWSTTACGYGCSDHASWHNRGFPATFPFEAQFADRNLLIHTTSDTLATLGNTADHAAKFARLGVAFAVETTDTPPPPACGGSDQATGLSGNKKAKFTYTFDVDPCATSVTFTTSGGSGEVDLYVRHGAKASTRNFDCASTNAGTAESCTIQNPQSGTWHVLVNGGGNGFSGVTYDASYQ
jgi:leucyl aminopeptidase